MVMEVLIDCDAPDAQMVANEEPNQNQLVKISAQKYQRP
jgi:hypothetical protein